MESLNDYFDALGMRRVAVIGCGGKTSLIEYLAQNRRRLKTLVTTTTKMALPPPESGGYDYFWDCSDPAAAFPSPRAGITLAGAPKDRKLEAIPLDLLMKTAPLFDYVLIEGDGSRTLPLKGWADYEPVVPDWVSLTVGVLPLWTLGMPVSEGIIHRLPLFTALTGARIGEPVSLQHLAALITGDSGKGLFSAARGEKILFFNQVETDELLKNAEALADVLPLPFRDSLQGIIAGSVQRGSVTILAS
jgi:probable selenium-dependent hydroxylase accessory protein YqeC